MGWVLMSEREVHRVEVLSSVVAGGMSTSEAASILCLSGRQVQRLLRTFREDGAEAQGARTAIEQSDA
jgi:transposase